MMINVDGLVRPAVSICIEHYNSPLVVQSGNREQSVISVCRNHITDSQINYDKKNKD